MSIITLRPITGTSSSWQEKGARKLSRLKKSKRKKPAAGREILGRKSQAKKARLLPLKKKENSILTFQPMRKRGRNKIARGSDKKKN